jgi:hypothetical protein
VKGFKTAIIDDSLAIAGKLSWEQVVEPIEGFCCTSPEKTDT